MIWDGTVGSHESSDGKSGQHCGKDTNILPVTTMGYMYVANMILLTDVLLLI